MVNQKSLVIWPILDDMTLNIISVNDINFVMPTAVGIFEYRLSDEVYVYNLSIT